MEGVDYFDTYAPVVSWTTVRLMFTLSIILGLKMKKVDYANAFVHTNLKETVYVEFPKDFEQDAQEHNVVLKLNKSLYGLKQAPLAWFEKLCDGLKTQGFCQSTMEPCLFIHVDMICLIYVDDCLFFAQDSLKIE